jgi:electron transfer flavoprotein beta subunit
LRIIVLIKPGAELERSDACAVEHALRIARRRLDVQVSMLTAGPPTCVHALREALALGADDAVHVPLTGSRTSPFDALTLSRILAATIRELKFDLVICGAASDTPNLSVLPAMVAARLGIPTHTHASHIDLDALDEPTLVSVTAYSTPPPRHPPFPAIAEARQKLISTRTLPVTNPTNSDPVITVRALHPGPNKIVEADEDPHAAAVQLVDFLAEHRFI